MRLTYHISRGWPSGKAKMSATIDQYYKRKEYLIKYLGGECVDCGAKTLLEFDHINRSEKSFNISENWSLSLVNLLKEVDKCELRCKSCHKIKTQEVDGLKSEHGKFSMYRHHKCRCVLCKEANRLQTKSWRAKKPFLA